MKDKVVIEYMNHLCFICVSCHKRSDFCYYLVPLLKYYEIDVQSRRAVSTPEPWRNCKVALGIGPSYRPIRHKLMQLHIF
jgi:hypothetical protein